MYLHCKKCLTGRSGDVLGAPCRTPGCDGIIEEVPAFSTLVDELPERMTCGRRFDQWSGTQLFVHSDREEGKDHWQRFKSNGNRVCSYCGSMHPDDFLALVKQCAESSVDVPYNSVVEIEPSDKAYKIYVHQPGVRNAHEGAIKFYTCHLPQDAEGKLAVTEAQQAEYAEAQRRSRTRFNKYLKDFRAGRQAASS